MRIEGMHIGMRVKHPHYGIGTVKALNEHTADIRFDEGTKNLDPVLSNVEPAEAQAQLSGFTLPLESLLRSFAEQLASSIGIERPDTVVNQLAPRWNHGTMVLRPADPTLQAKEIPLEVFFHKIVMMRNNFRVLEQKVNGHPSLTEAEKVEFQQYVTKCYGSLTTFNLLFRNKEDQFTTKESD